MLPRLISCLSLLLASHLAAQTTLADLQTRLVHQPLYLRGQWSGDKLKFDATGNLLGTSPTQSFTLSGIEIDSLKLDSKTLKIEGKRVGLVFDKIKFMRTPLKDSIKIEVAAPSDGDYKVALDNIFFSDAASFIPTLPPIWQNRSLWTWLDPLVQPPGRQRPAEGTKRIGGSVTAPVVLNAPEPKFTPAARGAMLSGKVLVYLQVDEQGLPQKILILRPLGLGLDELSADAVSKYRFKPADDNGKPVRVEMNVEVNFQVLSR
jgi:Gram-negative bacterial TonB protein C-terminal